MQRSFKFFGCLSVVGLLAVAAPRGMAQQSEMDPQPEQAPPSQAAGPDAASQTQPDDGFDSDVDRISYAIGMDIGASFREQGFELNPELLAEAVKAAYNEGELRLNAEQAAAAMQRFQQQVRMKQMEMLMARQAEQQAFLEENRQKEGVQETDSGLQYIIIEEGDGPSPSPTDVVSVHYTGKLIDGTVFDASQEGQPVSFAVNRVIPGFGEGLQLLAVGSKAKFFIPGELGYGQSPQGPGGPNATLIFEVELVDIEDAPTAP